MRRCVGAQAEECTIRVTVLDSTKTEGHKVKIQGVLVSDEPTQKGEIPEWGAPILPLMGGALISDRKSLGRRLLRHFWHLHHPARRRPERLQVPLL